MPESIINAMLSASRASTAGSNAAITGISKSPISAVKTTRTATSVSLKKRSTRYLSKCVEIAHKTGPESAKTSQLMESFFAAYAAAFDERTVDKKQAIELAATTTYGWRDKRTGSSDAIPFRL